MPEASSTRVFHSPDRNQKMEESNLIADIAQKALIVDRGQVLIVKDSDRKWQLPGGRLHKDEDPERGLKREIAEELGVDIEVFGVFDVGVFTTASSGQDHFLVVYLCRLLGDQEDIVPDPKEVAEMRWVATSAEIMDLQEGAMMWKTYKDILRKYFEGQR
ncbi:MAG: hypothetical protein A3C84_01825 [Candidatus Ryanbacteria bacterium RIFCSPHIGHO2_02_FULL_48_12]|nr:MAG: hypothetical protein A3C84_01825 [Candidatus Ryanbacteria bacterium RIFCSPHIGHO2_02_FULL_48_12]